MSTEFRRGNGLYKTDARKTVQEGTMQAAMRLRAAAQAASRAIPKFSSSPPSQREVAATVVPHLNAMAAHRAAYRAFDKAAKDPSHGQRGIAEEFRDEHRVKASEHQNTAQSAHQGSGGSGWAEDKHPRDEQGRFT